jgi:predicted nucleic acid-binding protein
MRLALDTNILAYAEGLGDVPRCGRARALLAMLPTDGTLIPAQVLGELARVLVVKARRPAREVREVVLSWADAFEVTGSAWADHQAALDLMVDHQLAYWDALILAVAAGQGCRILLSEDMQDGFTWRGLTVVNPFGEEPSPLLNRLLRQANTS